MTELTPETLAEWRKDAEDSIRPGDWPGCGSGPRILALLDALAAEKARADGAERWKAIAYKQADDNDRRYREASVRADKAEQERDAVRAEVVHFQRLWVEVGESEAKWKQAADAAHARANDWMGASASREDALRAAEARVAELEAGIAQARQWISTCVDPLAVGGETKQQMLDDLRALTEKGAES